MTEYYVQVAKGLTYTSPEPLEVGDEVLLPPTWWMVGSTAGPWTSRVTALGRGDYDGPCRSIIRKIGAES
jgi:hypothetical protein